MPYDFMSQFSRPGAGFAGRPSGTYVQPYYGMPQQNVVQASPATAPPPAMMPQQNFFDQLAGLFGVPQQQGPAKGTNPWAAQQQLNQWTPGTTPNFGNFRSAIQQMPRDSRGVMMPGGQGPYGGVPKDVQQGTFRGRAAASGRASSGRRANPLGGIPMPKRPAGAF